MNCGNAGLFSWASNVASRRKRARAVSVSRARIFSAAVCGRAGARPFRAPENIARLDVAVNVTHAVQRRYASAKGQKKISDFRISRWQRARFQQLHYEIRPPFNFALRDELRECRIVHLGE